MTNRYAWLLWIGFTLLFQQTIAQEIENTTSYKNINADGYIRLYGDDDYPAGTDEQYTEGMNIELVMPWIKQFPLSKLLVHPRYNYIRYGIGAEQSGFTPHDLKSTEFPTHDRPFAATLFLKTFLIATDFEHKQRFATTLCTGIIGSAAIGDNIQYAAHVILNNVRPPGWKYQIRNDVILNYQVNYEKQFLAWGNFFSADVEGMARAGTLSDKAGVSLNLMAGYFESPFSNEKSTGKFHIYVYDHPEVDVVGYDATLQGGLFNRSSPYFIADNNISRAVFSNRVGIVAVINRFSIEYNECYLTRQFLTGPDHLYAGIQLAIAFNDKKKLMEHE